MENGVTEERRSKGIKRQLAVDSNGFSITVVRGGSYHSPGQSPCICVRLFRSQCNHIAPSLREHICATLDRPGVNKYWGTGSKK